MEKAAEQTPCPNRKRHLPPAPSQRWLAEPPAWPSASSPEIPRAAGATSLEPELPPIAAARDATCELVDDRAELPTVWLRVEQCGLDESAPRRISLAPGREIVIGSAPSADVKVDDATVSARHCRVAHRGTALEVSDLGSRNGVRVGGVRVQQAALVLGGHFELGRTLVRIDGARTVGAADEGPPLRQLVGRSRPMRQLAASVRGVARLRFPALLRGESGTGKDLVARALHEESDRADKPFVVLNAATIPGELAESELFGFRRGAFTGALRERRGAFQEAHRGTLFLDEIASLSLGVQAKLLRVVEEGVVRPLGAEGGTPVDVRLIVATCEPLEQLVAERYFRADLYERLAVCRIHVPALRERAEDIALLAEHLLATSEIGRRELSLGAIAALRAHRWPGNVRELRNVLIQAALKAGGRLLPEHVTAVLADKAPPQRYRLTPADAFRFYEEVGGNISAAARRAEVPRSTMRDLLRTARTARTT